MVPSCGDVEEAQLHGDSVGGSARCVAERRRAVLCGVRRRIDGIYVVHVSLFSS